VLTICFSCSVSTCLRYLTSTVDYKLCSMPVDTCDKMSATDGAPVSDATDFQSLACALQYLTFTKLDIS
jgi:hypothetical protein